MGTSQLQGALASIGPVKGLLPNPASLHVGRLHFVGALPDLAQTDCRVEPANIGQAHVSIVARPNNRTSTVILFTKAIIQVLGAHSVSQLVGNESKSDRGLNLAMYLHPVMKLCLHSPHVFTTWDSIKHRDTFMYTESTQSSQHSA